MFAHVEEEHAVYLSEITPQPIDEEEYPLVCDICGKRCRNKQGMNQHKHAAHGIVRELGPPTVIAERYRKAWATRRSGRGKIYKTGPHKCKVPGCYRSFPKLLGLSIHMRRSHNMSLKDMG